MALISEVADKIYEIKPEGEGPDNFPLCTVYLVVDDKTALVEVGSSVQIPDILDAVSRLGYDIKELSYIIPTHVHSDHAGGTTADASRIIQVALTDEDQFSDTTLKGMQAGEDQDKIARRLAGILAKESVLTAEDILSFPYFSTLTVEGYRQSFKRKNLI